MQPSMTRKELSDRLLASLKLTPADGFDQELLRGFATAVLKRADESYLARHRITTLGAQLADSCAWMLGSAAKRDLCVRAFVPSVASHGYELDGVILETLMPDQPFIVDTLQLLVGKRGLRVKNRLSLILPVRLDGDRVTEVGGPAEALGVKRFSYTRWYFEWPAGRAEAELEDLARHHLTQARAVVADFGAMVAEVVLVGGEYEGLVGSPEAEAADCREVRDFLGWLAAESFVFMGLSQYHAEGRSGVALVPEVGLGIARGRTDLPELDASFRFLTRSERPSWPLVKVRKSPAETEVHRAGKVDEILVRRFDPTTGKPMGGIVIHGTFTFKALRETPSAVPVLRRKVERILAESETVPGSHDHKRLLSACDALPVEFLFEAPASLVRQLLDLGLQADTLRETRSRIVRAEDDSSAYVFVAMPKEHYSDDTRVAIQKHVAKALGATYVDHRVQFGKLGSVTVHFYVTAERKLAAANNEALEQEILALGTPWTVSLRTALHSELGEEQGEAKFARWGSAFSEGYMEITSPQEAVVDLNFLELVLEKGQMRFFIFPMRQDPRHALLRIYSGSPVLLTDVLPAIDHFGLVVIEQFVFDIQRADGTPATVNTLRVERGEKDVLEHAEALVEALRAVFAKRMRSDRLNRLLLKARLTWREVDLLRALFEYSRQLGRQFKIATVEKVLSQHVAFASGLAALFHARFDPDLDTPDPLRARQVGRRQSELEAYLAKVTSFEEDRILHTFLNLVLAATRTNFYLRRPDRSHYFAVKLDSAQVADMPEPRPLCEIFVHHAEFQGIHLRGGRVARGGLRFSDRLDDFRSEVLGLMATQMLKNTLIVPVGAKGGFVLTDPVEDPAELRRRGDRAYRTFVQALLEVTDNILGGEVVPPARVWRYDGDDPYLVVAADKGTAHLSDTANAVAREVGFWLGDAFASGGSVGYDHKEKGITARGAWVCVRRHFREMEVDPEADPIRVVGVGDMAGDVFGNGMLLSRSMKLVAAFNHRHVFLDPSPDPERSFAERERLFRLPRSQWSDYDRSLLSAGGGVFERAAKSIGLSREARALLQTDKEAASAEEVIQLILMAEVDLLWNGGIGTYVKASWESHAEVGDKDNDRVRVSASELRCKVFAEGGNLGLTMGGRVEYASRGGRINLDAIDNSGGVDLSDHEVNLKILLARPVQDGRLGSQERDELLKRLGDEVCKLVLANSAGSSLALSLDLVRSERDLWEAVRALELYKARIGFSRRRERLPQGLETIEHRLARKQGLLRPELGKLLAFSKMTVFRELRQAPPGTREERRPYVACYFPAAIVERFGPDVDAHMLFEEIAATVMVNHLTERAGVSFVPGMLAATGRSIPEIVAAYLVAEEALGIEDLRRELLELDRWVPSSELYEALLAVEAALMEAVFSLLNLVAGPLGLSPADRWPELQATRLALTDGLDKLPTPRVGRLSSQDLEPGTLHIPTHLAIRVSHLKVLMHLFAIADLAGRTGEPPGVVAQAYFAAGHRVGILALAERIHAQVYREVWDRVAVDSIRGSLGQTLGGLTAALLGRARGSGKSALDELALAEPHFADVRADIETLLQERIPVSATFVVSERLRQRTQALDA
jgi:glutamate dehydrogenase